MRAMPDRYAYLGPEGTFTEAALLAFASGPDVEAIPCVTIQATLEAVRTGVVERAVVPIETVGGHPQAQPQCRRWLAENLPDVGWRPASSNAEAARQAADGEIDA